MFWNFMRGRAGRLSLSVHGLARGGFASWIAISTRQMFTKPIFLGRHTTYSTLEKQNHRTCCGSQEEELMFFWAVRRAKVLAIAERRIPTTLEIDIFRN